MELAVGEKDDLEPQAAGEEVDLRKVAAHERLLYGDMGVRT